MRRWIYFSGLIIFIISAFFLFNTYKRNTSIDNSLAAISIPDSSWLTAVINLPRIRTDIAWNTFKNGDVHHLFTKDTIHNSILALFKSPSDYGIAEDSVIRYFSKWENGLIYHGLIFSLEDSARLGNVVRSGHHLRPKDAHIFRTKEGIWIFDHQSLLVVLKQEYDSIIALRYFNHSAPEDNLMSISDSSYVSCKINGDYIPQKHRASMFDSMHCAFHISSRDKALIVHWSYNGLFSDCFENATLEEGDDATGIHYSARHSAQAFLQLRTVLPSVDTLYQKQQDLCNHILQSIHHNTLSVEFNGWQRIRNSYYASEMNEEFEMQLKKKDTTFQEPVFRIQIAQPDPARQANIVRYLTQQGLIAFQKTNTYKVIAGNFDSELISAGNTIIIQNKNTHHNQSTSKRTEAAFLLNIIPSELKEIHLTDKIWAKRYNTISGIEQIHILGTKDAKGLSGDLNIRFKKSTHPLLQVLGLITEMRP